MAKTTLSGNNFEYDKLTIDSKRKFVEFNVYVDGCGQTFTITKEELKRLIE